MADVRKAELRDERIDAHALLRVGHRLREPETGCKEQGFVHGEHRREYVLLRDEADAGRTGTTVGRREGDGPSCAPGLVLPGEDLYHCGLAGA